MFERIGTELDTNLALLWIVGFYVVAAIVYGWLSRVIPCRRQQLEQEPSSRLSWAPEAVIAPMLAAPIMLGALAQRTAVAAMARATAAGAAPETIAGEGAAGIFGDLYSASYGAAACGLNAVVLGLVAATLVRQRLHAAPPPADRFAGAGAALIVFALIPLCGAVYLRTKELGHLMNAAITSDGVGIIYALQVGLQETRPTLQLGGLVALGVLALGVALVGLALAKSQPRIEDARGPAVIVATSLVLSAAFIAETLPYAAENDLPLDDRADVLLPTVRLMGGPDLRGPLDAALLGPRVQLSETRMLFEGEEVSDFEELDEYFEALRSAEPRLYPGEAPMVAIQLGVESKTQAARVLAALRTGARHGFTRYFFGFHRLDLGQERPLLGPTRVCVESWLEVSLDAGSNPPVEVTEDEPFEPLARRSIDAANTAGVVYWRVSEEPAAVDDPPPGRARSIPNP